MQVCRSKIPVAPHFWTGLFFRLHVAFPSKNSVAIGATALTSELPIYARFVAEYPRCIHCGGALRIDLRPLGTTGPTPCTGCAWTTPSFPSPPWLRSVRAPQPLA